MDDEEFEDLVEELKEHRKNLAEIAHQFDDVRRDAYRAHRSITEVLRVQTQESRDFCAEWEPVLGAELYRRRENGIPNEAGLSLRRFYDFEIVDEDRIPREFLKVDRAKLKKAVKKMDGNPNIPGVRGVGGYNIKVEI